MAPRLRGKMPPVEVGGGLVGGRLLGAAVSLAEAWPQGLWSSGVPEVTGSS